MDLSNCPKFIRYTETDLLLDLDDKFYMFESIKLLSNKIIPIYNNIYCRIQ